MDEKIKILVLDDSEDILVILEDFLANGNRHVKTAPSGQAFRELMATGIDLDVALVDIKLPDISADEVIDILKESNQYTQIIIITGVPSEDMAIEFLRKGVFDFIKKPINLDYLEDRVLKAAERKTLLEENAQYVERVADQNRQLELQSKRLEHLLGDTTRELLQSTEYLKTIVSNLPEGILLLDYQFHIVIANQNAEELLGLGIDYRGKSCLTIDGNSYIWPYFQRKLNLERIRDGVNSIEILPNDRIVYIEIVPIKIDDEVENYIAILKDVTMEQRHKSWLEAVMNTLIDGITIIDKDRNIIWMNQVAAKWSEEHATGIGNKCFSWFHCADTPHAKCPAQMTFVDGKIHRTTLREITKMGEERFYDVITGAISPYKGDVHQIVEIRRNVTARARMITDLQKTMADLERANRKLNQKIEQLSIVAQITDTLQSTNNLTEILHIILTAVTAEQGLGFNRSFLLLLDPEKKRLKGKYAIGPSDAEEAGKIWAELSRSKGSLHEVLGSYRLVTAQTNVLAKSTVTFFDISVEKEDNVLIDCLLNHRVFNFTQTQPTEKMEEVTNILGTDRFAVVPIHTMTDNLGVLIVDNRITQAAITDNELGFLRVITNHAALAIERSYLAEELQEKYTELGDALNTLRENQKKLIRAEKLSIVGQMAAQLAHEIKNPLVAIGGFARNLLKDRDTIDDNMVKKLEIIRDETSRIEKIVTNLLRFARIQEPRFEYSDIGYIVKKGLEIVEVQLDQKNLKVETEIEDKLPQLELDREQIHQVLLNLMTNAISATPKDGSIFIGVNRAQDAVHVEVRDTGTGIEPEYRERVFEPFFTTKSAGTGLGLAISAQIIKKHNGTIWFTSTPEKGTAFHIKLPVDREKGVRDEQDTAG